MTDMPQAPAGWYEDPQSPGQHRYWNGVEWLAPSAPPPPPLAPPPPPQVAYPAYMVQRQSTNGFAIASMVLGIVWIYWIGSVLALVFGYMAKRQIKDSQGREGGDGMATAGIVLGWLGVAALVVVIALAIIVAATGSNDCQPSAFNSC
jgi:Domain of unknown function (DUF4190)/Protein of unknown function (DUF2510)